MRHLILASIFFLAGAAGLHAQQKTVPAPPAIDPADPLGFKNPKLWHPREFTSPSALLLTGKLPSISNVCSVPLLEARVQDRDRRMAVTPSHSDAAMPKANVPAPACTKP